MNKKTDRMKKVCSCCKKEKELDKFHNCRRSKDGKQQWCSECKDGGNKKYNNLSEQYFFDWRVYNNRCLFVG